MRNLASYLLCVFVSLVMPVLSHARDDSAVRDGVAGATEPSRGSMRPLVFVFQKQKDPASLAASADAMASLLGEKLGREVRVVVPGDYAASVQALVSQQADVAYVSSLPFLLARRDGRASLLLAEQRVDPVGRARTDYDSVLVVREDSPLRSIDDLKLNSAHVRFVFTSPTSTSGYVFPYARLIQEGLLKPGGDPRLIFKSVAYGGSYTQALQQVVDGRGDVAAVSDYTVEGPRADVYLPAEHRARLRILARTAGVPTHLLAVRGGLDEPTRQAIRDALLDVSRERPDLLADVYGASALVSVDEDAHVRATVRAIEDTKLPIEGLAR